MVEIEFAREMPLAEAAKMARGLLKTVNGANHKLATTGREVEGLAAAQAARWQAAALVEQLDRVIEERKRVLEKRTNPPAAS